MGLKVERTTFDALSETMIDEWRGLLTQPRNNTPFFYPDYVQAVAQATANTEVLLIEDSGCLSFLPIQTIGRRAYPVGLKLADYSGLITQEDADYSYLDIVRASSLLSLDFSNCLINSAQRIDSVRVECSHSIDLQHGYSGWEQAISSSGSSAFKQAKRKWRKIEREVGKLQFEWHSDDPNMLTTLLEWKAQQRLRSKSYNVFDEAWANRLAQTIQRLKGDDFCGCLSVLRADDQVIALHLGMRTKTTMHWWVPSYSSAFEKYSPGILLLLHAGQVAADEGIQTLDLGKGEERYKLAFCTDSRQVDRVFCHRFAPLGSGARELEQMKARIRGSKLESGLKDLRHLGRRWLSK